MSRTYYDIHTLTSVSLQLASMQEMAHIAIHQRVVSGLYSQLSLLFRLFPSPNFYQSVVVANLSL
eukprot:COSAG01_NODE_13447_length_1584_cov_24.150842_3_plen_64_part_01